MIVYAACSMSREAGAMADRVELYGMDAEGAKPQRHMMSGRAHAKAAGDCHNRRRLPMRAVLGLAAALAVASAPAALPVSAYAAGTTATADDQTNAVVINVRDYGAVADSSEDAEPGIVKALEEAKKATDAGKSVVVSFPKGRYDIYPDKAFKRTLYVSNTTGADTSVAEKSIGILVEGMNNVTIEGNGSQFMFHGKMTTFAALESENVTFRNYSVDFQVPTVVDVTVESVEGNSAIVYVPECYNYRVENGGVTWSSDASPYSGETYWSTRNAMNYTQRYDTVSGLTWRGDTNNNPLFRNSTITDAGNHRLKITWSNRPDEVRPGMCYQMRPTKRDHPGTFLWKSKNVVLSNLDIHFLHGFGMVGQSSENITLDDVDFQADMTRGHTTTGYADFIQMSGCKGNIEVKNCSFSNPHDDPINVHGTYLQVTRRISDHKIEVTYQHHETSGFPNYFVGDKVEFFQKSNLLQATSGQYTVTAVDGPDGRGGSMGEGSGSLTKIILTFEEALPEEVRANSCVAENVTYTPSVYIHDNVFKETPTRGVLVTTRGKVRIENNMFDGMGMAAIFISDDNNSWYESGHVEDVTISGNVFKRGAAQAILVDPTRYPTGSDQTVHRGIKIENNTFFTSNGSQTCMAVDAKSVNGLSVKNNRFLRLDAGVQLQLAEGSSELTVGQNAQLSATASSSAIDGQLFWMGHCRNVEFMGNEYDGGLNARLSAAGMDPSNVTFTDDAAKLNADSKQATGDEVVYEPSDPAVLMVSSNGTVTANAPGTATVTMRVRSGSRLVHGGSKTFTVSGDADAARAEDAGAAEAKTAAVSSDAFLAEDSSVTGTAAGITFSPETTGYFTTATTQERALSYHFAARDANAKITATFNDAAVEATGTATLGAGINVLEVTVAAPDGITTRTYRFVVLRSGDSAAALASLTVDGAVVELKDGEYAYAVRKDEAGEAVIAAQPASATSRVLLSANGGEIADGHVQLHAGLNKVSILVVPETGAEPTRYELSIKVPQADNAVLEQLSIDGASLDSAFDSDTLEYHATTNVSELTLTAQAQEPKATVELVMGKTVVAKGTGSLTAPFAVRTGETPAQVRVTSPDASEVRTYKVQILATGELYLSDMVWSSATAGDNREVKRDASVDGADLTLWNGKEAKTFEKGLGTHANSEIQIDLTGRGYTTFNAQVGVDYETNLKPNEANVIFEVCVDGVKRFESPVMHTGDAFVSTGDIDVTGASMLKLVARGKDNIYSAHADWADAKLSKVFEVKRYAVKAASANDEAGSVALEGVDDDGTVEVAAKVTAQAEAKDGYVFAGWFNADGEALSDDAEYTWTVYADASIEARFTKKGTDSGSGGNQGTGGSGNTGNGSSQGTGGASSNQTGSGNATAGVNKPSKPSKDKQGLAQTSDDSLMLMVAFGMAATLCLAIGVRLRRNSMRA